MLWSSPERWEPGRDSWLDRKRLQTLGELLPGFMRWRLEGWRDALREAVCWYGIANDSTRGYRRRPRLRRRLSSGSPTRSACAAVGSSTTEVSGRLGVRKGRGRWEALDLPREIPSSAGSLRKALEGSQWNQKDAARALANIRNDLVLGGRGRFGMPVRCCIEAWALAMWIVELATLFLCGYRGWHWNRNSKETEKIPWVGLVE